jgi:predicted phage-related endonuclease
MLWAEKTGRVERPESPAMRMGTLLQPTVAALVEGEGYEVMPAPEDGYEHPEHGFMLAHLDGFVRKESDGTDDARRTSAPLSEAAPGTVAGAAGVRDVRDVAGSRAPRGLHAASGRSLVVPSMPHALASRGILEVKTRGTGWKDDAKALAAALMQMQHYFAVVGGEWGLLAVLHGGYGGMALDLRIVRRDDALIALMVELEREFVELVRTDTPPDPDGSDSAREAVRAMAGEAEPGKTVRATPEVWKLVKTIRECDERIAAIKAQREQAAQTVQAFMGDAEELVTPFDTVAARWPTSTRKSLDTAALKAAHPSIAGEFTKATTYRTFNANPAERKR